VGFELTASAPERVRSLTILNTVVAMDAVPFPMEIYARLAAQWGWAALPPPRMSRALIYAIGISDRSAVSPQNEVETTTWPCICWPWLRTQWPITYWSKVSGTTTTAAMASRVRQYRR
jgi:hypothetical protein